LISSRGQAPHVPRAHVGRIHVREPNETEFTIRMLTGLSCFVSPPPFPGRKPGFARVKVDSKFLGRTMIQAPAAKKLDSSVRVARRSISPPWRSI